MDLTNIQFGKDPLGIGSYQAPSHYTPKTEYQHPTPNNHFYYYQKEKESSSFWEICSWVLGIGTLILGYILYNMPDKEIEKTLKISEKDSWDLAYIEAKKKVKKAEYKKDVGWVIYK
jgi:hypothetical protein